MKHSSSPTLDIFRYGGQMGLLMDRHDWSNSSLGPPGAWPQSLRSVVGLILASRSPMFVVWGAELGFLYNDAYIEILGHKHPSALGNRFTEIWSEIWHDIYPIVGEAMLGNPSYFKNSPLKMNRNGVEEDTWFTFSYSPVFDESSKVAGMFCVASETTEQVLGELHRNAEVERLRDLFAQAPGTIAVLRGPEHIFDIANEAYSHLVGKRDLLGISVREALPEVVEQGFVDILDQVYRTGKPFIGKEMPVKLYRGQGNDMDNRYVNFLYQPTLDASGKVNGIFVEGNDVTEQVLAFKALQDGERRLRQLANTIPHLAWMANADGWIHWYNERWYTYTGTTLAEMEGWGWRTVHHPDWLERISRQWNASIATGEPFESTFPLRGADGRYRSFFTRVAPLHDADGNITQWFGTNTDISPIEVHQRELESENRRKDEFLAMLAHELRNPLAPIATASGILNLTAQNNVHVLKASDVITRQVIHITKLLDDLLDVSRVTRGVVTIREDTLDVGSHILDAVEQVQELISAKNINFKLMIPENRYFIRGDSTRIIQIFANILNNAAKYTPQNGNVELNLSGCDSMVSISVSDNGIGIAPDLLPNVFDLFTQAERTAGRTQGGLGLGLALVKNLVGLHRGVVSAESTGIGQGSRFTVVLPEFCQNSQYVVSSEPEKRSANAFKPLSILVIDDNRDAAELMELLLSTTGHKVAVAHNGRDALAKAIAISPSVLLVDIGLPDMDGYDLAKRLRSMSETRNALLIAVTGYGQPKDLLRADQAGFNHHLVKPANLDEIYSILGDFSNSVANSPL